MMGLNGIVVFFYGLQWHEQQNLQGGGYHKKKMVTGYRHVGF